MRTGVDLGGTKIEAIAMTDAGKELARIRRPTPVGDYKGTIRAVGEIIRAVE